MTTPRYILLIASLFLVYTQGMWERLFGGSPAIKLIVEGLIMLYLLLSVKYFKKKTPGSILFLIYLIFSFAVSILNGSGALAWLKYIRYFAYFYLLYITIFHTYISNKQWVFILKFAVFLILIQGLGSIYNVFILKQRVEGYVGLMSSIGGTTAATYPLFLLNLTIIIFFFHKSYNHKFIILILIFCASSFLVGYSSGKRAIYFTFPIFIALTSFISLYSLRNVVGIYKKFLFLIAIILLISPVYFFGIRSTSGVNYYLSGNENKLQVLSSAIEYAVDYEDAQSFTGLSIGRSGSTLQVIKKSLENRTLFFVGQGYGKVKDENTISDLGVGYGIVGITRDIISAGWIVMLITGAIVIKVILTNWSVKSNITNVLRITILLLFLYTHITYSSDFVVSLKINFMLIVICTFINSPKHIDSLRFVLDEYFLPEQECY